MSLGRRPGRYTQATRCLSMLRVLLDGRWRTFDVFQQMFGVTSRTVRRDVDAIACAGWFVEVGNSAVRVMQRGDGET